MSKVKLRNDLIVSILLVILVFSISSSISLAKADPGGTGKYVTLQFSENAVNDDSFFVTATKEASEQSWTYPDPITKEMTQKLGAGSIALVAYHPEGYLVSWELGTAVDNNEPIIDEVIENIDSIVFKSTKYAYIKVTFTPIYTLSVDYSETTDPAWGSWEIVPDEPYYQEGDMVTIFFTAESGYHLSSVLDNNGFASLIQTGLTIMYNITFYENHNVTVAFDEYGEATVPSGSDVTVFLGNEIGIGSLLFVGTSGGTVQGGPLHIDPEDGTSIIFWEVIADNIVSIGDYVIVSIPVDGAPPADFNLYTADERNALWSDVDGDGSITHDDMVEVAIAINDNGREYNSKYDINGDGTLNQTDIDTVKDYIGTTLTEIVHAPGDVFVLPPPPAQWIYDADNDLLLIATDHFSIFRGR